MELKDIIKLVKNRLTLIIIITLSVTVLSAFASVASLSPTYKAESTVIIGEPKLDNLISIENGTLIKDTDPFDLYQKQLRNYLDFARSKAVFQHVITTLKLDMSLSDLQSLIGISPEGETGFFTISAITDDPKFSQGLANQFAKSFKYVSNEVRGTDYVTITSEASLPGPNPNSKTPFILKTSIGFFFGLMLGFGIALLLEFLNNSVKSREGIESLTNLPVVGLIPRNDKGEVLLSNLNGTSKTIKAYRTLSTILNFSMKENNFHSFVFTSAKTYDEKSILLSNTAITLSQCGKKVLILDCDLRNPLIHETYNLANNFGISDILLRDVDFQKCIKLTEFESLNIINGGQIPLNSSELLGSNKFKNLLEELQGLYDIVLINSSPLLTSVDSQILSSICDQTIIVASYGKTVDTELKEASALLQNTSSNILGIVLNNVPDNIDGKSLDFYLFNDNPIK